MSKIKANVIIYFVSVKIKIFLNKFIKHIQLMKNENERY
ncbi:hypothetical protein EcB7A_5231 [Escherichia coli B7A]|nr:hypothetical protein EcB7A_5231 [Escherichia coli B7A]